MIGPRLIGLVALAGLPACATGASRDPMVGCMLQISPPGSYSYPAGQPVPVATPGPDGTQEGADALNACVRARTTGARPATPETGPVAGDHRVDLRQNDGATVRTYTYGTPPSRSAGLRSPTPAASPARGAHCPPGASVLYGGTTYCVGL